jgi:hypothetical protein
VRVVEILRRLNEGEAGLPFKVPIGRRQVYTYREQYRAEHGMPHEDREHATIESVDALEQRVIDLMAREIHALEKRKPGTLTAADSRNLNAHHTALVAIERRAKREPGRQKKARRETAQEQPESVLDRLAREQREGAANGLPARNPGPDDPDAGHGPRYHELGTPSGEAGIAA